jgi:hypothetical protein
MAERKYVRTIPGMRVDQPDFNQAAVESQRQADEQLLDQVLMDPDFNAGLIISGFDYAYASGVITITRGRAIVSYRDNGQIRRGMLIAEGGPAFKQLSVASLADNTYNIYLRGKYSNTDPANRVVWNADATTPVEVGTLMATRVSEDWDLLIADSVSVVPNEWIPLYSVSVFGGAVIVQTDLRRFYFEGRVLDGFTVTDAEFGDANDRAATRATTGVTNVRKAIRGLQRQVQDIIGQSGATTALGWWKTVAAADSLFNKLNRDGTNTITGNIAPDGNGTRLFGSALNAFDALYSQAVEAQQVAFDLQNTSATDLLAGIVMSYVGNSSTRTKRLLARFNNTAGAVTLGRIYVGNRGGALSTTAFYLQIVFNAEWDNATNLWTRVQAGDAYVLEVGNNGVRVGRHLAADALTWTDTYTGSNWQLPFSIGDSSTITVTDGTIVSLNVSSALNLSAASGDGPIHVDHMVPSLIWNGSAFNNSARQGIRGAANTPHLNVNAGDRTSWYVKAPNGYVVTAVNLEVLPSSSSPRTFDMRLLYRSKDTGDLLSTQAFTGLTTGASNSLPPISVNTTLGSPTSVPNETGIIEIEISNVSSNHIEIYGMSVSGYIPVYAP